MCGSLSKRVGVVTGRVHPAFDEVIRELSVEEMVGEVVTARTFVVFQIHCRVVFAK
jgi:hypothetical protein